jgi:DNA polymerase I-like protein with 3'-5' exonuclease and polymerase domains
MNVVWLTPPRFTGGLLRLAQVYCSKGGINAQDINFVCITAKCLYKRTKTKWDVVPEKRKAFEVNLAMKNPDFIVINDRAALKYITGKYLSLALCRGGIYYWTHPDNGKRIPCLVVDEARKIKTLKHGAWVHLQDMKKLKRWLDGKQRRNPRFDYEVCRGVDQVRAFKRSAEEAIAIAIDIETTGTTITCIGYSCWLRSGKIFTWVIPFYNTQRTDGCHWETAEDEAEVWKLVREIHANNAYKGMQNGQYDSAYFISYRCPVRNYIGDSLHMSHAIWREAPKRLDFISSVALDYYRYWKDEGKEDAKDDTQSHAVPRSASGLENYWLYNALDCHNTLLDIAFLLQYLCKLDWAMVNYTQEFESQFGFCLATSMRGVKVNQEMQLKIGLELVDESDKALDFLRKMTDDPEFNPNSHPQVKEIIYDVLGAEQMGRKGRSSDEKVLKFIKTQSWLLDVFIDKLWECKKAKNNASKYGFMPLLNGRFMYELAAAGTYPGRFASKSHQFWIGQNIQNMPKPMRCMIEADPGYFLFDIDYSQSDAYFTAFESEDEKYMNVMLDDRDTHCVHAEHFFKVGYDKLLAGHKNHEDWVDHSLTGIRQNTKRITYGANYLMTAYTLYTTMGRDAAIGAAKALGYADAETWTVKQFTFLCQKFLDAYFEFYPGILPWLDAAVDEAIANGNRATAAFGNSMIFFGDLRNDKKRQRDFAAFWGQGGTAGNINTALRKLYRAEQKNEYFMSLFQVHDSYIGQIKQSHVDKLPMLMRLMENEITIKGRKFIVPTEASIGIGWGKRQLDWHEGMTANDIRRFDSKWLRTNGYS